jgi:hypothetical protein
MKATVEAVSPVAYKSRNGGAYMVMVIDFGVFRNGSCTLHDPDSFIIVTKPRQRQDGM